MNFRRTLLGICCFCIFLLTFTACKNGKENVPETTLPLLPAHEVQGRELGKTESIIHQTDTYAHSVHYPVIDIAAFDQKMKAVAEQTIADFLSQMTDVPSGESRTAILNVDYKTYAIRQTEGEDKLPQYASVIFMINIVIPHKEIARQDIYTVLFDLAEGKEYQAADIFREGWEDQLSQKLTAYFRNNRLYSGKIDNTRFMEGLSAAQRNFSRFHIADNKITFYFHAGELFDASVGIVSAVFSLTELSDILAKDFHEAFQENPPKPSTPQKMPMPETPKDKKLIAFTFDDGPHEKATVRILDLLEKNNARATFFVLGTRIPGREDIMKRTTALNCEIGNHSYSHADLSKLKGKALRREIDKTNRLILDITGYPCQLFRVPYGSFQGITDQIDLPLIQWCIDTEDWRYKDEAHPKRTKEERNKDLNKVANHILDNAKDGDIVLMHDLYDFTADVFAKVLPELQKRGFALVTVSEMFAAKKMPLEAGGVYRYARAEE